MKLDNIRQKLNDLRGESRTILWVAGFSRIYCAATVGFFALALFDYVAAPRSLHLRLVETLLLVALVAWAAYRRLIRPLRQPVSDRDLAQALLRRYPQLAEALPAAVEFLPHLSSDESNHASPKYPNERKLASRSNQEETQLQESGAAALQRKVVQRAEQLISDVDVRVLLNRKIMLRWLGLALICAVLTLTCFTSRPVLTWTAVERLTQPLNSVSWPQRNHLGLLCPTERIAEGGTLTVIVFDRQGEPLPDDLRLEIRGLTPNGDLLNESTPFFENPQWESILLAQPSSEDSEMPAEKETSEEPLAPEVLFRNPLPWESCSKPISRSARVSASQSGILFAQLNDVQGSLAYRIRGGDDHDMPWRNLSVLTPPKVVESKADLFPPEYSGLSSVQDSELIAGLPNTRVLFRASTNKPLREASLLFGQGDQIPCSIVGSEETHLEAEFYIPDHNSQFAVLMTDEEGLTLFTQQRFSVRSIPDAAPMLRVVRPQGNLYLTDNARVPLLLGLRDDLGLTELMLHVSYPESTDSIEMTIPLSIELTDNAFDERLEGTDGVVARGAEYFSLSGETPLSRNIARGPLEDVFSATPDIRTVAWTWDLESLNLGTDAKRVFWFEARDNWGQNAVSPPYRLEILDEDELQRKVRSQRALLIGELQAALDLQTRCSEYVAAYQKATRQTDDAEIPTPNLSAGPNSQNSSSQDASQQNTSTTGLGGILSIPDELEPQLETSLHTQRRVSEILTDVQSGVPWRLEILRADITRNALDMPETLQELDRIEETIQNLHRGGDSDSPLNEAQVQLGVAARQARLLADSFPYTGQNSSSDSLDLQERVEESLQRAKTAQQTVMDALSTLVGQLEESTGQRRRQAAWAEIEQEQRIVYQGTAELATQTLNRPDARRTPGEIETATRWADAQTRLADAAEPLLRPTTDSHNPDETPENGAITQSEFENMTPEQRDLARTMRNAGNAIRENRMGQAVAMQRELLRLLSEMSDSGSPLPLLDTENDTDDTDESDASTPLVNSPFGEKLVAWRDRQILLRDLTSVMGEDDSVSEPDETTLSRRDLAASQNNLADNVREIAVMFDQRGAIAHYILQTSDRMDVASARISRSQPHEQTLQIQQAAIDGLTRLADAMLAIHEASSEGVEEPTPQDPTENEPPSPEGVSSLELRLELELTRAVQTDLYHETMNADQNTDRNTDRNTSPDEVMPEEHQRASTPAESQQEYQRLAEQQAELGRLMLLLHERMSTPSSSDPEEPTPGRLIPPSASLMPSTTTFGPMTSSSAPEETLMPAMTATSSSDVVSDETPGVLPDASLLSETEAPAADIGWKMNAAARLLEQGDAGLPTQQLQTKILDQIADWIEQIPLSQGDPSEDEDPENDIPPENGVPLDPGGPGTPAPENPGSDIPAAPGEGTTGDASPTEVVLDPEARQELMQRVWGTLPDAQRELMSQLPMEEFLPAYGPMIGAYFERLASEQEMESP